MLHCLELLNPMRCFFTVSDFDDLLLDIDSLLHEFKDAKIPLHAPISQEKKQVLETAYALAIKCLSWSGNSKPDRQLAFLIADILRHYGQLCEEHGFFCCKQMLIAALNLHLYAIGIIEECIDMRTFHSLEELKWQCVSQPNLFSLAEESILSIYLERCVSQARGNSIAQSYPGRRLLSLAETARWLGYCYQHLDAYLPLQPENNCRFHQLFTLSEMLLLLIDTEESKLNLAALYYQAWPFMYERDHPDNNVEELSALYNKALACDPSPEMQAKVNNRRFLAYFKADKREDALLYLNKAHAILESLPPSMPNQFLLANLHSHYACFFMHPEILDMKQAEQHLSEAIQFATDCRARGEDSIYFAFYDMRLAELKLLLGDLSLAQQAIERAINCLKKYPNSNLPFLKNAEALQRVIIKMKPG